MVLLVVVCSLLFGCVCWCFGCFWVLWWLVVAFVVHYVLPGGCVLVVDLCGLGLRLRCVLVWLVWLFGICCLVV